MKNKLGRALPALMALLIIGSCLMTSANADVQFNSTNSYSGASYGRSPALRSANAAEWIAATAAAAGAVAAGVAAGAAWAAAGAAESIIIIIILGHPQPVASAAQRAQLATGFNH